MASEIERLLFGDDADQVSDNGSVGNHGISQLSLNEDEVRVVVTSWDRPYEPKAFAFREPTIYELRQTSGYPDDFEFPWNIRGVFATRDDEGAAKFLFICEGVRLGWTSQWPELVD